MIWILPGQAATGGGGLAAVDWSAVDWAAAIGRLHPVTLHLPIGLLVALVGVELWTRLRRAPKRDAGRTALLGLLAATTPVAATSGWLLHESESYGQGVELHEYLGIGLLVLCLLTCIGYWRGSKLYGWSLFAAFLLLFPTAHLGGSLTHGETFLLDPILDAIPEEAAPADSQAPLALVESSPFDFAHAQPFFESYCTRCHGERKRKGGLALHTMSALLEGGDRGPALAPGAASASRLVTYLRLPLDDDDHMPPPEKGQPTPEEIDALAAWVDGLTQSAPLAGTVAPRATPAPPKAEPREQADHALLDLAPALDALRRSHVHVERLGASGSELAVDFTAAAESVDGLRTRLGPLAPHLVELGLAGTPLAADDLVFLGELPALERLDLRNLPSPTADLAPLGNAPKLTFVNLAGTRLDPADVAWMEAAPALEEAVLWNTALDEGAMADLANARASLRVRGASSAPADPLETEPEVVFQRYVDPDTAALSPVNLACPVTGSPIDPRYSVVDEGRVVGFCCPNCPKTYWQDPAAYRAELPTD